MYFVMFSMMLVLNNTEGFCYPNTIIARYSNKMPALQMINDSDSYSNEFTTKLAPVPTFSNKISNLFIKMISHIRINPQIIVRAIILPLIFISVYFYVFILAYGYVNNGTSTIIYTVLLGLSAYMQLEFLCIYTEWLTAERIRIKKIQDNINNVNMNEQIKYIEDEKLLD